MRIEFWIGIIFREAKHHFAQSNPVPIHGTVSALSVAFLYADIRNWIWFIRDREWSNQELRSRTGNKLFVTGFHVNEVETVADKLLISVLCIGGPVYCWLDCWAYWFRNEIIVIKGIAYAAVEKVDDCEWLEKGENKLKGVMNKVTFRCP